MKKTTTKLILACFAFIMLSKLNAQIGFNCQYVPGLQVGTIKVKGDKYEYRHSAPLPLMMVDAMKDHLYYNLDMNSLYYIITQMNRGKYLKIAKNEGGLFAGRIGWVFGKSEKMRIGGSLNFGWKQSNIDSTKLVTLDGSDGAKGYTNIGAGIIAYYKVNSKLHTQAKIGYESLKNKKIELKGRNIYVEATVAYKLLQKYGVSVMPNWSFKKFDFNSSKSSVGKVVGEKHRYFGIRFGLTKFF